MERKQAIAEYMKLQEKATVELNANRALIKEFSDRAKPLGEESPEFWALQYAIKGLHDRIEKVIADLEADRIDIENEIDDGHRMFPSDGGDI